MVSNGIFLGRLVTLTLLGDHVNQGRTLQVLYVFEGLNQFPDVVTVNGTHVLKTQGLEQNARGHESNKGFLDLLGYVVDVFTPGEGPKYSCEVFFDPDRQVRGELLAEKG